jgi:glycerol-3-phosphate dehydrogenase
VTDPVSGRISGPLERRARDVRALADERWDLVVVGGGIVGAGVLLDAVSRGLRAALIEQDDIASGTSSRSSRLIHGGLRYLERLHVGLVRESLRERARLLELAPHLVRLEPQLFPLYGRPLWPRVFYGSGIGLYDALGSARSGGRARHLGRGAAHELAPVLPWDGLRGAIVYHDAVEDDARYTLGVVRTALGLGGGAVAVTRARVGGLMREAGRVAGVAVEDRLTGQSVDVRARHVVDATGAWAARSDGPFPPAGPMTPSLGAHLVVARDRIPSQVGLTLRVPGKVAIMVQWADRWLIGTTDAPYEGPLEHPAPGPGDVDALLEVVNRRLDIGLTRDDLVATYAGVRPLVGGLADGSTVRMSREHRIAVDPSGLVRVGGGKFTTYRVMAREAVDAALGEEAERRPSRTGSTPIVGAAARSALPAIAERLARDHGLPASVATRLVSRHGTEAGAVAALGASLGLLGDLAPDRDHVEAEVVWAAREELALSLDDVLARRTRLATELHDHGAAVAPRVAELLGAELAWDEDRRRAEVERFIESSRQEYDVPG